MEFYIMVVNSSFYSTWENATQQWTHVNG